MFMDAASFAFLAPLQRDWEAVRDEMIALREGYFIEWPERDIYSGGRWSVFGLFKLGNKIVEHCEFCPRTTQVIEQIPGLVNAGFSSLAPGTVITPHVGYTNQVLRCHLGLVTPERCAIRVGNQTRSWSPGSCFVFDDTHEHEAWNRSHSTRVVLLLDFKRDANAKVDFPEKLVGYDPISRSFGR